MRKDLKLIERKEIHVFEWGDLPHKITITTVNGQFTDCQTTISAPKTREDWVLFALIAQKIEQLTPQIDEWQVRNIGDPLIQTPTDHPNAIDLVKSFDEEAGDKKDEPSATGH